MDAGPRSPAGSYAGGVLKFFLVVALFAVAVYLTVRVIERRGVRPAPRPAQPRVMGPDDDPDFIWDLNKKSRKKQHPDDPPPEPSQG